MNFTEWQSEEVTDLIMTLTSGSYNVEWWLVEEEQISFINLFLYDPDEFLCEIDIY